MPRLGGHLDIVQVNDPSAPAVGRQHLYFKSDGVLYTKKSDGTVTAIGTDNGGGAPANMVTTDTDQTITGAKTFTNYVTVDSGTGGATFLYGEELEINAVPAAPGNTMRSAFFTGVSRWWNGSASVGGVSVWKAESPSGAARWTSNVPIYEGTNRVLTTGNLPPAPANMVTTDTAQTITGSKTFAQGLYTTHLNGEEAQMAGSGFYLTPARPPGIGATPDPALYPSQTEIEMYPWTSSTATASVALRAVVDSVSPNGRWASNVPIYENDNRVYSAANPPPATVPSNMVTTNTTQTITADKTIAIGGLATSSSTLLLSPFFALRGQRWVNGASASFQVLQQADYDVVKGGPFLTVSGAVHAAQGGLWDSNNRVYSADNLPPTDTSRIASTEKGVANGVATLGSDSKIPSSQLPALAITDTFVVANQNAMLALTAEIGDVAVRSDLNKSFILRVAGAGTLSNWQELLTPTDAVLSVNSQTGAVVLTAANVGAVATTGNETIAGAKTFSSTPIVPDSSFNISKLSATGTKDATTFLRGDNTFAVPTAVTALTVTPVTAAHTAVAGTVVLANGTFTVTLPTPVSGSQITVKNTGTGTITIIGTVDGTTTTVLASQYQSITVVSDGTAYYNI